MRPLEPRLSAEPLQLVLGRDSVSIAELGRRIAARSGVEPRSAQRSLHRSFKRGQLTITLADEAAAALFLPAFTIWGEEFYQ